MSELQLEPLSPSIGAIVHISADGILEDGVPERVFEALNKYNVLVFPQINLTDDQLIQLTEAMGSYEKVKDRGGDETEGKMGIYRVALDKTDKTRLEYVQGNDFWHMDGTSYKMPGKGTLLKCEVPPEAGGDTGFANLFAAYEALPEEKKQQIASLRVVHCLESVMRKLYDDPPQEDLERWNALFPPTEHPLVWKRDDGRASLVIGATAFDIVGMSREEGGALIKELNDWCTQDQFTYRHHWQKGDLVIFNNPGLLHRSFPYTEDSGRVMHRTTLKGYEEIA